MPSRPYLEVRRILAFHKFLAFILLTFEGLGRGKGFRVAFVLCKARIEVFPGRVTADRMQKGIESRNRPECKRV